MGAIGARCAVLLLACVQPWCGRHSCCMRHAAAGNAGHGPKQRLGEQSSSSNSSRQLAAGNFYWQLQQACTVMCRAALSGGVRNVACSRVNSAGVVRPPGRPFMSVIAKGDGMNSPRATLKRRAGSSRLQRAAVSAVPQAYSCSSSCHQPRWLPLEQLSSGPRPAWQSPQLTDLPSLLPLQDEVLIAGFGRRGHAVGDIPGVRFKVRPPTAAAAPAAPAAVGRLAVANGHGFGSAFRVGFSHPNVNLPLSSTTSTPTPPHPHPPTRSQQVVKVSGVSLLALFRGKKEKVRCCLMALSCSQPCGGNWRANEHSLRSPRSAGYTSKPAKLLLCSPTLNPPSAPPCRSPGTKRSAAAAAARLGNGAASRPPPAAARDGLRRMQRAPPQPPIV